MSASSDRMLKLMAYADGELTGAERDEVEGWLAQENEAVRFANELANLGDLVKTGFAASPNGKAIASFDIADAVMAKVAAEPSDKREAKSHSPTVVGLDAERARRQKNVKVGAAALAALALAASVFMMTRSKEEQPMARAPVQLTPAPAPAPTPSAGPGVDVDLVETPGHSVSVFYLPSESTLTTSVVVWVDETGEKK
jgi:anti-sigma factor RsiW